MSQSDKACDFCSCRPVVARHQIDVRSVAPWEPPVGEWWYACADCHTLILADDRATLAGRAVSNIPMLKRRPLLEACGLATAMHVGFWDLDAGVWEPLES